MKEFVFTWFLENISYSWHKTGECIVSPTFFASSIQNTAWCLSFYPRGCDNSDFLSLYLVREKDQVPVNLAINFELSILSTELSTLHSSITPETFKTFSKGGENSGYGESRFIKRYEVFDRKKALYLPQDILALRCRMWKDENEDEFGQIFGSTRLIIERIVSVEKIFLENLMNKTFHIRSNHQGKTLISVNIEHHGNKINLGINPIGGEMKTSIFKIKFEDERSNQTLCEHESCFFGRPHAEMFPLPFSKKTLPTENDNSKAIDFQIFTELVYSTGKMEKIVKNDTPVRIPKFLSNFISWEPSIEQNNAPTLSKNLWNLYNDRILCEVELKTSLKSFFVHKIVLCARSPVFLAMLTGEMKEKVNKCIEIEDISADTLEKFVIYLYTDAFEDLEWNVVFELYYAADKYQVERLKFICCSYLLENADFENISELLILADRHGDFKLIQKVKDFIWSNEEKVFRSSTWKKLAVEQPQLALKIMLSKYEEKDNQSPFETIDDSESTHSCMSDYFRALYHGQIINDIVIQTTSATFPAHKTVLYASSQTFKEKLTRLSQIKKQGESTDFLEIKDLEEDTVSRMLLFLYTDSLDIQWDIAKKLYHAANVYQIQSLKFKCSCFLLENLNVSNASNILLLAHEYNDLKLKTAVEYFIHLYDEEIFGSDEWAKFSQTNLLLANEIMRANYKKK